MSHLSSVFIEKLHAIRERVPREVWLALAARYRETSAVQEHISAADLAMKYLGPNQAWALRQAFKDAERYSWGEIATAFDVVDTWVASTPKIFDVV